MNSPSAKVLGRRPKTLVRRKSAAPLSFLQKGGWDRIAILTKKGEKQGGDLSKM